MKSITFKAIQLQQPIGIFYIGAIDSIELTQIARADVREMTEEDKYLGIQRRFKPERASEIGKYTNTKVATFPTSIILAIKGQCVTWNPKTGDMTLSEYPGDSENGHEAIAFEDIARILDGQHRVAGLKYYKGEEPFEINVAIFIDADLDEQANIFATVNLAQTKVNKSLVYDLFDLAKSRSPQKTCHKIAVALNDIDTSPLYHRIKRLGVATEGRYNETITQATFVEALLKFITSDPNSDRDNITKGRKLILPNEKVSKQHPFRSLFIQGKDLEILKIVSDYFTAVAKRWPEAWGVTDRGMILNRTNGFRALIRFLKPLYLKLTSESGKLVSYKDFLEKLEDVNLDDSDFNTHQFPPGSSGESRLYKQLCEDTGI